MIKDKEWTVYKHTAPNGKVYKEKRFYALKQTKYMTAWKRQARKQKLIEVK